MDPDRAVRALADEASTVSTLLTTEALTRRVPSCPGWTVADLARHLGVVHRWARHAVLVGPDAHFEAPVVDEQVRPWFNEGASALIETLTETEPTRACWTLNGPSTVAFWIRRQAHETTLHRWDMENSLGTPNGIAQDVALDGISEVASVFVPRQLHLGRLTPGPEVLDLVPDRGPRTHLGAMANPAPAPSSAAVHGPADVLSLLLWKRTTLNDPRLNVSGSQSGAKRLLAKPLTP